MAWTLHQRDRFLRAVFGMNPKAIWSLVKQAITAWASDFAPSMGAALSYYTLF